MQDSPDRQDCSHSEARLREIEFEMARIEDERAALDRRVADEARTSAERRAALDAEETRRSLRSVSPQPPIVQYLFSDASYAPPAFTGSQNQDADKWLKKFNYYVEFRHMDDDAAIQLLKLLLTESAADWLESVPAAVTSSLANLRKAFIERYDSSDVFRWQQAASVWSRQQARGEKVDTYITDILNLAKKVPIKDDDLVRFALIKGLQPSIKQHVLQSASATLQDVMKAARVAEAAASQASTDTGDVASLSRDVKELIAAVQTLKTTAVTTRPTTPERVEFVDNEQQQRRNPSPSPRRVSFADRQSSSRPITATTRPGTQMGAPTDWSMDHIEWRAPHQSRPTSRYPPMTDGWSQQRYQPQYQHRNYQSTERPTGRFSSQSQMSRDLPPLCRNCFRSHPTHQCQFRGRCFQCQQVGHVRQAHQSAPSTGSRPGNTFRQ